MISPMVKFWPGPAGSRGGRVARVEVGGGEASVQVGHLEVHGPLAEQVLAFLLGEGAVRGHDEVRLAVLVDQPAACLHVLEAQVFAQQAVGNHPASPRLQHWK